MTDSLHPALLPAGLADALPPEAAQEAGLVERLLTAFGSFGFQRVKPPLIEFEDSLLGGSGAALARQTFRMMDPLSQQMLAVRADMTLQVARIATTRLGHLPRPLRLAYGGQVLRVKGTQLRPERQFGQLGGELIGSLRPEADAEVVQVAVAALTAVGVSGLSVDLCVPTLVPALLRAYGIEEAAASAVQVALDRKDAAAVAAVGTPATPVLVALLAASGLAGPALAALGEISLPADAEPDRRRLVETVRLISAAVPGLHLTVDPVERRGFEYQTGVSFTLFARGIRGELGRGGRYRAGAAGEPATGFSLYTDTVLRAAPAATPERRLFLPHGTAPALATGLRAEGWTTVAALEPGMVPAAEARRLGCGWLLNGHTVQVVDGPEKSTSE